VIEFSMRRAGYTPAIELLEAALGGGTRPEECEEGLFGAALRVREMFVVVLNSRTTQTSDFQYPTTHKIYQKECRSVGDGGRALRFLGLAPESQLREVDFANAIHACGAAPDGALLGEAIGAFRRLQALRRKGARAG
jgi:hypothetical protein